MLFEILYIKLYLFFTSVLTNFDNGGPATTRTSEKKSSIDHG